MSRDVPQTQAHQIPREARIAIVAARFNGAIVDELLTGCLGRLEEIGANPAHVETHRVPGAFELPLAAKWIAGSGNFAAVICLGCVIRGDTPHFDFVAGECARGIQQAMLDSGVPIIFGVLTTDTEEQARQRAGGTHGNAGARAADAAAEMIGLRR
ncbi:MAG: 6,7-dimethyl-8-ribityllumazine synthase, partial [Tepidisphaeraceae bacterium]